MYENEMPVFDLQTDVFDALVPGLMPLAITLGIYYAIKKVSVIMIFLMVVSFVLGILRLVR